MDKDGFIIYKSFYKPISRLSDEQLGRLFRAIFTYQIEGYVDKDVVSIGELSMAFEFFIAQFERDGAKYQEIVDKRKVAGSIGGKRKQDIAKQANAKIAKQNKQNLANVANQADKDKDIYKDISISNTTSEEVVSATESHPASFPLKEIIDFWNRSMGGKGMKQVLKILPTSKRGNCVRARLAEYGIEKIYEAIQKASESEFLNGKNSRGWLADFEWVFLPNNFPKVLEGKYDNNHKTDDRQKTDNSSIGRDQNDGHRSGEDSIADYVARNIGTGFPPSESDGGNPYI